MASDLVAPNTKTLDHIVHLTPPGTIEETAQQFRGLGFTITPGGTHTDGLTANSLVLLGDGIYLELLSFTKPVSAYPPGSREREARENHNWAQKIPGWIDFAFLGNGVLYPRPGGEKRISDTINERVKKGGGAGTDVLYKREVEGGRQRPDGRLLKWVITAPAAKEYGGTLPFFCGDVTPRDWRVPATPQSTDHPNQAIRIVHIILLTSSSNSFASISTKLTSVVGTPPSSSSNVTTTWSLNAVHQTLNGPNLILTIPRDDEEEVWLQSQLSSGLEGISAENATVGIFEVAFRVKKGGKVGVEKTPFGRIRWLPE